MNLEIIKEKLELEGYSILKAQETLIGGTISGRDEQLGFDLLGKTFSITIKNDKIVVDYALAQVPKDREFSSIEEVVNFIREVRPL